MRLITAVTAAGLVLISAVSGCGPRVSEEEFGTILFEVPEVPGSEEPYKLPAPVQSPGTKSAAAAADQSSQ